MPQKLAECFLVRDLAKPVFSVDFEKLRKKPVILRLWNGNNPHGCPVLLRLLLVRENGMCYYSSAHGQESQLIMWIAACKENVQSFLMRALLILAPSRRFLPIPPKDSDVLDFQYMKEDDTKKLNTFKIDTKNGQAECGVEAAIYMGMLTAEQVNDWHKCRQRGIPTASFQAFQIRAVLWAWGNTLLCKGLLVINPKLGMRVILPESVIKASSPTQLIEQGRFEYGIDIIYQTETPPKKLPELTPSLVSVLRQRAQCQPSPEGRAKCHAKLDAVISDCKEYSLKALPCEAFGLHQPQPEQARTIRLQAHSSNPDNRMDRHRHAIDAIKLTSTLHNRDLPETSIDEMREPVEDPSYGNIKRGTRAAVNMGFSRMSMLNKKLQHTSTKGGKGPRLRIPATTSSVMATSDLQDHLPADKCIIINDGKAVLGKVVVWRYPAHGVTDVEILTAVEPPTGANLPQNCIILSIRGRINSGMAGGDLDGDKDMFSTWTKLIEFVESTEDGVRALKISPLEDQVKKRLTQETTPWISSRAGERYDQYLLYVLTKFSTAPIRGDLCNMADRAVVPYLESKEPFEDGTLTKTVEMNAVSHIVLDVPKKFSAKTVSKLARSLMQRCKLKRMGKKPALRSSQIIAESLRLQVQDVQAHCEDFLEHGTKDITKGVIWLPKPRIVLGRAGGKAIVECLLSIPGGTRHCERAAKTSILQQAAQFLHHKWADDLGKSPRSWVAQRSTAQYENQKERTKG